MKLLYLLLAATIMLTACGGEKTDTPENNSTGDVAMEGLVVLADVQLEKPASWTKEEPTSSMRTFQYGVSSSDEAKVIGFYFGGEAGDAESNIQRWKNEFTSVENEEELEFADGGIKYVRVDGTFKKKPFPMAQNFEEAPGYTTLAAIVPTSEGPYYVKLNGPKAEIDKEEANFIAFLKSYKK